VKALTIRQPWAHAILQLGKDVENRTFRVQYQGPLLIHAAAFKERHPRQLLVKYVPQPPSEESLLSLPLGHIVGVVHLDDCVRNAKSVWAQPGKWHWLLSEPRPIRPVMCKGWLGLWTPSTAVMRKLPRWVRSLERE
jgi:hypothetical protein